MTDTAQPLDAADPNVQLQNAANAFKALDAPERKRDETGRFASEAPEEVDISDEGELPESDADTEGEEPEVEATEEDGEGEAEEAHPLPPSWRAEDKELWETLPVDAQARIAEREAERDRGLNLKLQESANARKEAALAAQEAQNRRNE